MTHDVKDGPDVCHNTEGFDSVSSDSEVYACAMSGMLGDKPQATLSPVYFHWVEGSA